ncbi:hypothetical protein VST7929_02633 [Vibrio stylophorae]|uniref:Sulfatase N-terminal domain-containing protein n=1 Tax=Vibrio stylophorae TaxID=659351 RepID=A0ABM8ZWH4_9VIBR|nr:alkaline phosphatase family protein [Vibrio stylophorae]CAH0534683.1 hypothetical protein VST7929_02633 [Vibrio stylophorae]
MLIQHYIRQLNQTLLRQIIAAVLILFVSRILFFAAIVDADILAGRGMDFLRSSLVGVLFDLKTAAFMFLPMLLIGLGFALWRPQHFPRFYRFEPVYAKFIFFLIVLASIGNYLYYTSYGNHYDLFLFGVFDDDTEAIMSSAMEDFPLFRMIGASILISLFASRWLVGRRPLGEPTGSGRWWHSILSLAVITIYIGLAQAAILSEPKERDQVKVSDYPVINKTTPNALVALGWATIDYQKQGEFEPISDAEVTAQMEKVLGQPTPEYQTPANAYLEKNQPHVVFALMEGMGTSMMLEDDPQKTDLLRALRPAFESDFVFQRFVAGASATIDSMAMMLFHSNVPTLSHSVAKHVPLASSAVLPYKKAGYETVYITVGDAHWRNLDNYLPLQGFDRMIDDKAIIKAFPEAAAHLDTWGLPDEYGYRMAEKVLAEATKPTFIFILTITNHPPYHLPDNYQAKPVEVTPRIQTLLGPMKDDAANLLLTYQYANDMLGQFIARIKASPLANRTVIAASGDHRVRYLAIRTPTEQAIAMGVPFYLYVPKPILASRAYGYDNKRIGSHRDIFPTLYNVSLSDADYVSLGGDDLLSINGVDNIGYNATRTVTEDGVYDNNLPEYLYPWQGMTFYNQTQARHNPNSTWAAEYRKLQDYYLRSQVADKIPQDE